MEEQNNQTAEPHINSDINPHDIEQNKIIAVIGYIGILCFVPLFFKKDSYFAQFHSKQSLVLLTVWIFIGLTAVLPIFGWMMVFFGNIGCFVLMIVGMKNAWEGQTRELPFIGKYAKHIHV